MKVKLGLFLTIPALLLASCGPKKVSYDEFKEKAKEALQKRETVNVTEAVVDAEGSLGGQAFKGHAVFTVQDGVLTLDAAQSTFEGDTMGIVSAQALCDQMVYTTVEDFIDKEETEYEYAIKPLTVYMDSETGKGEMRFDEYGSITKMEAEVKYNSVEMKYEAEADFTYAKK